MKPRHFANLFTHLYAGLLRLYAPSFRLAFGEEMQQVFAQAAGDAAQQGWLALLDLARRELAGLPRALLAQWRWRGTEMMETTMDRPQTSLTPEPPLRGGALLLALLPLFILGLGATLSSIPLDSDIAFIAAGFGFMMPYLFVLVALLWGWLKGFPRWSYPYLAHAFFFAMYIANASTPGFSLFGVQMWDRQLWAWRAFVPVTLIAVVALSFRAGRIAVPRMFSDIWGDWTRIAYAIYGLLPLIIVIVQDETGRDYRFPTTAIAAALMLLGAALYLGLASPRLRQALMLAGAFLTVLVAITGSNLYWATHDVNLTTGYRKLIEGPVPWGSVLGSSLAISTVFTLFLLAIPALVGLIHWLSSRSRPGAAA